MSFPTAICRFAVVPLVILAASTELPAQGRHESAHAIRVIDEGTGRGVPLVELATTADAVYMSDSGGYVAIDDPTLLGRRVFFRVEAHGYEHAKDSFGFRGRAVMLTPGKESVLKLKRLDVAERMYRITGAGIYRDTVKLGKPAPIKQPLLNAQVVGQDSVQAVVRDGVIHWFWGDTDRLSYPLGQFNTSGATSKLSSHGGLEPDIGVNLEYYTDSKSGFSRPMFQRENGILIWIHGLFTAPTKDGSTGIYTHWSRRKGLAKQLSHGIGLLNETTWRFESVLELDDAPLFPRGHSFRHTSEGNEYIYFADPYALVRTLNNIDAILAPEQWEAFTPLKQGSRESLAENLDRDEKGRVRFGWKKNTAPVEAGILRRWVNQDVLKTEENALRTLDAASGKPILLHRGSIHWNKHRKRWIMIATQSGGENSFLGNVWYSESRQPSGPFSKAVQIAHHKNYSFYNPTQHPFFDQEEGRWIYFEGTYTSMFSGAEKKTPWYDYNQIMYRVDLDDPRLKPAFAN